MWIRVHGLAGTNWWSNHAHTIKGRRSERAQCMRPTPAYIIICTVAPRMRVAHPNNIINPWRVCSRTQPRPMTEERTTQHQHRTIIIFWGTYMIKMPWLVKHGQYPRTRTSRTARALYQGFHDWMGDFRHVWSPPVTIELKKKKITQYNRIYLKSRLV